MLIVHGSQIVSFGFVEGLCCNYGILTRIRFLENLFCLHAGAEESAHPGSIQHTPVLIIVLTQSLPIFIFTEKRKRFVTGIYWRILVVKL